MIWSPQQEAALDLAGRWRRSSRPYFVLAGYAGTGKTTLARHLAEDVRGRIFFAAYTGKAAHVLRKTGVEASTIHQLVYLPRERCDAHLRELLAQRDELDRQRPRPLAELAELEEDVAREQANLRRPDFYLNTESPLWGAGLLVIDEYSMVDEQAGRDIMGFGCPVLALGDPGQLPPVKGNCFFREPPDVVLTEIHRQAAENPIIRMSRDVREGRPLRPGQYGRSRVVRHADVSDAEVDRLTLEADQVLVGTNRTRRAVNKRMRWLHGRRGDLPVTGDKLVCLRNNHQENMWNGQTWVVLRASSTRWGFLRLALEGEDGERVTCLAHRDHFEGDPDRLDPAERRRANELDFGYALTCHKSQGSQWDTVLVYDEWRWERRREWLYTAVTRAAEAVTIVC